MYEEKAIGLVTNFCGSLYDIWHREEGGQFLLPMNIDLENIEKGINFFNEGNYFEAHETWEDQWREIEKSPEKYFIQGLIVIAVAFHHYKRKNYTGTSKLLQKGIKLLQEFKEPKMNIDIKDFLREIISFQERFKSSGQCVPEKELPRIKKL